MTAPSRLAEFAAGTGTTVVVDSRVVSDEEGARRTQAFVHVRGDCESITQSRIGEYPTERMARSAIPNVKACKSCR